MDIHEFIRARPYLIWYTKNYDGLNEEAVVEATLNYGDWDDVQKLIKIMGIKRMAEVFRTYSNRPRSNYDPIITNYFNLYFAKHA